jgi:hypothetical protein
MKTEVKNRLVMTKGSVAATRPAKGKDFYSWVWVLPTKDGKFRVAAVEIPRVLVDEDRSFFDEDFETPYIRIVDSIDDIDSAVREAGADPGDLDFPWRSNFPL